MKVLIDTCVLYPTVLREIVLGCAAEGLFEPLWSRRIMEEWRHAAARETPAALIDAEIARTSARFPDAIVDIGPETEATLSLPDINDRHVLAAAIEGRAETLLTLNLKDFPGRTLARHDVMPRHPDCFLCELFSDHAADVAAQVDSVLLQFAPHTAGMSVRGILKRARLPRLAKALPAADR